MRRNPPQNKEVIDRQIPVSFSFDGKNYSGFAGDTIASALAANNVSVFSRSFKYHRPRGLLCCAGHCPNCLVQVGDEMNVRACTTPVEEGMQVEHQNAWPSLDFDIMSAIALGDAFLPAGFYYKTFMRPKALWPIYEHTLRHAAGLGKINPASPRGDFDKRYLHGEVVVVGGGPAGMAAALQAAEQGAQVLLLDENSELGGHTRYATDLEPDTSALIKAVVGSDRIDIFRLTTVLGWWEENWLSAVQGDRLYKIRAQRVVFATGTYEQPMLFDNNDLPGIMLGSAVQRLLTLHSVLPGERAVVITANDDGWRVASDLKQAGAYVTVVDERSTHPALADCPIFPGHSIRAARGGKHIQEAVIRSLDGERETRLPCDLLVISVGWAPANGLLYQAGAKLSYDPNAHEFLPQSLPEGLYGAGRVTGSDDLQTDIRQGRLAGRAAAASLGFSSPDDDQERNVERNSRRSPGRTSDRVVVNGNGKQFLCYCEDVTYKDLQQSIEEGYSNIELLKRYSTISMGPCQGKMCSVNAIHLCARENGSTVQATGTTTARPPMTPVKLGALGGQPMEPVRYTPVHTWHEAHAAKMMVAGLWMRPEHYGNPAAEVHAVRERVGLIDVSTLGKLKLTGPGAPGLLDKMYVNKWHKLDIGRVRYGVMCNDEGVITDDGVTARLGDLEWYTTTTSSGAISVFDAIQWWAQSGWGEGVHITNVTEDFAAFNLAGPRSRDVLASITNADVSNEAFPYMHVRQMAVAGIPTRVFRIGFTGELSYEIHCPAAFGLHLWEAILAAGETAGISPFGIEAQRILRLEKAHIIVGQDTDALSDPISANMAWIVKHDKLNFLGNRPLARIAHEGPAQKLVGFIMESNDFVPEEGLQIIRKRDASGSGEDWRNLEIIGWITSSRFSPTLGQVIGMCWLPSEMAGEVGSQFSIWHNGSAIPARVHHGAFYDPDGERLRS